MPEYYRPLVQSGPRPEGALPLCGGPLWFDQVEVITRDGIRAAPAAVLPEDWSRRLCRPRGTIAGMRFDRPVIMGILNVTPDSFSDGGQHATPSQALAHARAMVRAGADLIDIGGESTRPGAEEVPAAEEIRRTAPVVASLTEALPNPVSIDTRKADVARAALREGASLINDVSGFTHDPALLDLAVATAQPVCVMHMRGTPADMHDAPAYDNALLDTYDELEARIAVVEAAGIPRARILADPGIGFAKTAAHNLEILQRLSLFHGLGCPLLLGVSRKRFIASIGGAGDGDSRMPGSVAVALAGVAQGVQMLRVHDVAETAQALRLWLAVRDGKA